MINICSVKPIHYDLSLYELELGGGFTFQGTVKIQVEIKEPTSEITLNAIDIKVHAANVSLREYGPSGRKFLADLSNPTETIPLDFIYKVMDESYTDRGWNIFYSKN